MWDSGTFSRIARHVISRHFEFIAQTERAPGRKNRHFQPDFGVWWTGSGEGIHGMMVAGGQATLAPETRRF